MTSALTSSTQYMLPASLQDLHVKTLSWESTLELWKRELAFFQKLIDHYGKEIHRRNDVEEREHFKLLLDFYSNSLMKGFEERLLRHEAGLKQLLRNGVKQDEATYRTDHFELEHQIRAFDQEFLSYKHELYLLIEKVLLKNKHKLRLS